LGMGVLSLLFSFRPRPASLLSSIRRPCPFRSLNRSSSPRNHDRRRGSTRPVPRSAVHCVVSRVHQRLQPSADHRLQSARDDSSRLHRPFPAFHALLSLISPLSGSLWCWGCSAGGRSLRWWGASRGGSRGGALVGCGGCGGLGGWCRAGWRSSMESMSLRAGVGCWGLGGGVPVSRSSWVRGSSPVLKAALSIGFSCNTAG